MSSMADKIMNNSSLDSRPVLETENGAVAGVYSEDRKVRIFRGIPFAASTGGENRWKKPAPAVHWDGVLDCSGWGKSAVQDKPYEFACYTKEFLIENTGVSEDCLNLCIYTSDDGNEKKPVLVYIHGGGFISGGCSCEVYDGTSLAGRGIVYVSIQYRVGALGFLQHPLLSAESESGTSGNYAIMDQITALSWIQRNIRFFGGDPGKVTVMGQSAGAASVDALLCCKKAEGLFRAAVSLSFPSILYQPWSHERAEAAGAAAYPVPTAAALRNEDAGQTYRKKSIALYAIDGDIVKKSYREALTDGYYNDVPLIRGYVTGDPSLFGILPARTPSRESEYREMMVQYFGESADRLMELYPYQAGEEEILMRGIAEDYVTGLLEYEASLRDQKNFSPVYTCVFTHPYPANPSYGAFHSSDLPYWMHAFPADRRALFSEADETLSDKMGSELCRFVFEGRPEKDWKKASDGCGVMRLDTQTGMRKLPPDKKCFYMDFFRGEVIDYPAWVTFASPEN